MVRRRSNPESECVSESLSNLRDNQRGQPNVAALLTWFLPGAGHVYAGQAVWGVAVFLVVNGLYWFGLHLADGMTFEFLDAELRSLVAPVLSPEVGNLGGVLWQMKNHGFGPGVPRPWPEWIVLGSSLTAASGMLNGFAMCHAHTLARCGRPSAAAKPVFSALLAWLVPGLGHVHQGRKLRGAIVFVLLVGLFVLGSVMAEGSNLSRERHFYYWAGQFVIGLPGMIGEAVWGDMRVAHDIPYVEGGLVFGCVAGLLNVLAILDVYGYGEAKLFGWPLKTTVAPSPESAPADATVSTGVPASVDLGRAP